MKVRHRLLAALLALTLLCSLGTPALAAPAPQSNEAVTGSITATVRIDYAQRLDELRRRDLRMELFLDDHSLGQVSLCDFGEQLLYGAYNASISARNADGGDLGGGEWPSALEVTVDGLPQGGYTLKFTGRGYQTFSQKVTLADYAQHVTLGTGDATFTLGDVTGDGKITAADRTEFNHVLGSTRSDDLAVYDLNGDGGINIVDLAYVNRLTAAQGDATVQSTTLLAPPADLTAAADEMTAQGTAITGGDLSDLFTTSGEPVQLASERGEVVLPIPLKQSVDTAELRLTTPHTPGEIMSGMVLVEDALGRSTNYPFDYTPPEGVHAIGSENDGAKVITIDLGKRVAVKKITITVTKTLGGEYAAVESIQFLQNIVPEVPVAPHSVVKNLKAEAGSEYVSLRWSELPNVSGYKVLYWPQDSAKDVKAVYVDVTSAKVTGLKNLQTYDFTVTPTDGSWEGAPSAVVSAMPIPNSAPDKVDMLTLKALDASIAASWKKGKSATHYHIYYRAKGDSAWTQFGGDYTATSATLTGLVNDVTYEVKVCALNDIGRGPDSDISQATPKAVKYERPEGIPTKGILDNSLISSIALADRSNYKSNQYTADSPFSPNNMIDGNYRTHWTAANWWRNEHVVTTFKEPVDLQAVFWVPRLDGSYPTYLRAYSVRVWYEGEELTGPGHLIVPDPARGGVDNGGTSRDVDTWPAVRGNCAVTNFALLPFGPAENVIKISVAIEQRDYLTVSCSQLLFMEYDPAHCLPTEISDLFADELRTTLKPTVTQAQIDALQARLNSDERNYYVDLNTLADELKLAAELLKDQTTSGLVVNGIQSRSSGADSKYSQGGSVLQPLGATASAKQEITVYATGIPAGQSVTLYASQFNAEASAWLAKVGTLQNGRNVLTVPAIGSRASNNGGSLYVTYSGAGAENIRLHVRRAVSIPVLELADWYDRTEAQRREAIGSYVDALSAYLGGIKIGSPKNDYRNVTEISTPVVLLSLPALSVNSALGSSAREDKITTIYSSIEAWEDIMAICKRTQGIDKVYAENDMQTRQNIRCMTMFAGAFMYAAGNHIGIGYGSCAGMVTGKPLSQLPENASSNRLFGWGIAHEIGHNMDKLGKAEITNNIYSILVQTYDGGAGVFRSRLEKSNKYAGIFTKVAQGYPGASNDVFVQLGMYYQLHLAYTDDTDPLDFYNRFFKAWKAKTYTAGATSYDDRVALTAAGVANADLTQFFTRWGMTLSAATKEKLASYPAESRAVWYLSDASRRARLAGTQAATGTLAASAVKTGDNSIEITFDTSNLQGQLQGFEIRRSGKSIAFVTAANNSYTDVIGSANHRVYHYEVVAYDILGNQVGEAADAGDIRVAYDKTVDVNGYTVKAGSGSLTVTFQEETAISGLKLLNFAPSGANVTVSVKREDGEAVTALATTLDAAHNQAVDDLTAFVVYFKLPGAAADDTRIGTYDALEVTIQGSGITKENLRFISYPGDDVSFLDGATMGLLSADYTYDTLDGSETIPAGTLVIVGNYRGDPVYNTLNVTGRFTGTATTEDGDVTELDVVERPLAGYALLFAAIPESGPVSDLSDGLFLFVPDVQAEAQLQEVSSACDASHLLPSQIRLDLYRTDDPGDATSKRLTAQTLWIYSPGGDDLPIVELVK